MSTTKPSLPMTGGCSCGRVRYEITTFPLLLYSCNCTDCQTASGSAFALNMPVATKGFRVIKGEPKGWHHLSPSGADVSSWFCGECGARIYGSRNSRPDSMNLRAGTLDDTSWLTPVAHMFMRSAQPWVKPADGIECHDEGPLDFAPLAQKWRALWPEFFSPK
ncbi:MAG TPA: GFA family protein [Rhizomicrobium sp.]